MELCSGGELFDRIIEALELREVSPLLHGSLSLSLCSLTKSLFFLALVLFVNPSVFLSLSLSLASLSLLSVLRRALCSPSLTAQAGHFTESDGAIVVWGLPFFGVCFAQVSARSVRRSVRLTCSGTCSRNGQPGLTSFTPSSTCTSSLLQTGRQGRTTDFELMLISAHETAGAPRMDVCHTLSHVGACQNYDPFWGTLTYSVPYDNRDPKRDHNFDNQPCELK